MQAYILGIPDRYRGQPLEADLSQAGIPFEVVAGVDGTRWTPDELARVYSAPAAQIASGRQLAPGEVACTLGHQRMMRSFADTGEPWALLLEDDSRIARPLAPVLDVLDALPAAPIVIQLDRRVPAHADPAAAVPYAGGTIWRQPRCRIGTSGYLMNQAAADIALAAYAGRRIDSSSDWPFCWRTRVQFWQTEDAVVRHAVDESESLVQLSRQASYAQARQHTGARAAAVAALKVAGVGALRGRVHGLPFGLVYRRDREQALAALRQRRG
jgi:glycosyl transferase, family 25